jgi:hypothetical protein
MSNNKSRHQCGDCGKVWKLEDLNEASDLLERLEPGDIFPSGECPQCGALCVPIPSIEEMRRRIVAEDGPYA